MSQPLYDFEWDPAKALSNLQKHGVSFDQAATVFMDELALTVYDRASSEGEERWFTLGCVPAAGSWLWRTRMRTSGRTALGCASSRRVTRPDASDAIMKRNRDRYCHDRSQAAR
jgi:uncharacterized protein